MGGGWKVGAARIRTERGQERLDSHVACKRYLLILRDEMIDRRCELSKCLAGRKLSGFDRSLRTNDIRVTKVDFVKGKRNTLRSLGSCNLKL